ncbi:MAG: DUF3500 domain-containing protein [Chitinophagaceae bacterium]|nr:DUF3500 domain-containing protein [Chitinophagaceae bacterium]
MIRSILLLLVFPVSVCSQDIVTKARAFIKLLDNDQRNKAILDFNTEERYNFHYIPKDNRKGIALKEMNEQQQSAAFDMLKSCLSDKTVDKVNAIIQLENVLKVLENQPAGSDYRDPGKYFLTLFGTPRTGAVWGWRFEGHHISFNFSASDKKLLSGTPSFLGSNPAIVHEGPQKGKQVLREETEKGFALLHALSKQELAKAIIDETAPSEIITGASRKAMIDKPEGVRYSELSVGNKQLLMQLLELYIHRYTKLFADEMLDDIKKAGLDDLRFAWAGFTQAGKGKACYYRIQGPTIIVEYDNSQNNANHIHTVVRDLKNDFGGDMLLQHYKTDH